MQLHKVADDIKVKNNAACLDGSDQAFYFRESPSGSLRWIIFLEGGGWCSDGTHAGPDDNFEPCDARALTDTGSSKAYPDQVPDYGGILSADEQINLGFNEDNHVFVKYCDGSSFTGERDSTVDIRGKPLHFRGRANLVSVLETLLQDNTFGL